MIREALQDIFCADTLALATSLIHKLESMESEDFAALFEWENKTDNCMTKG